MERMTKGEGMTPEEYIAKLEEENKKLKKECEENDYLVEDNARWMRECEGKTMEIKKLKSDLAYERTMLDNVRAEYKSLQNVNKKLNERIGRWEKCFKKGGFNPQDVEYLMEEDTLQELRDIGEI